MNFNLWANMSDFCSDSHIYLYKARYILIHTVAMYVMLLVHVSLRHYVYILILWKWFTYNNYCKHFVTDEGAVRLVEGTVDYEGRVEVYLNGHWGTVCDDAFGITSANVVCRQLGHLNAISTEHRFGPGDAMILLDDVQCVGNESRLVDCPRRASGHNCGHHEDIGVRCNPCPLSKY